MLTLIFGVGAVVAVATIWFMIATGTIALTFTAFTIGERTTGYILMVAFTALFLWLHTLMHDQASTVILFLGWLFFMFLTYSRLIFNKR